MSRTALAALALGLVAAAGCEPPTTATPSQPQTHQSSVSSRVVVDDRTVRLRDVPASAMVLVLDPRDVAGSARRGTGLAHDTAQRNERLVVLCGSRTVYAAATGTDKKPDKEITALITATPDPKTMPTETGVQQALRERAEEEWDRQRREAEQAVIDQEKALLDTWRQGVAAALARPSCSAANPRQALLAALNRADAIFASLRQSRVDVGGRKTIVVLGVTGTPFLPAPHPPARSLTGTTIVVAPFTGDRKEQAAWQAAFVQAGAGRAVLLDAGVLDRLPEVAKEGLQQTAVDLAADALFELGSAQLAPAGEAQLQRALGLIRRNRSAYVVVNGYTDSLPAPQGNDRLSKERAETVARWLIARGARADRTEAFGFGDRDPIAPDTPGGQPRNRRVVVVVNPQR